MKSKPMFVLAAAALLGACAHQAPVATEPAVAGQPPFSVERTRVEHKILDGVTTVVIDNPYGDIQIRQTRSRSIALTATEQRIGERPREARLEWFHEGERQGLRVRYAEHDPETAADPRLGRVDLGLFVPPDLVLDLRTDFGSITVRRVRDAVTARSRSGRITVAAHGAAQIESESGEVRYFPMGAAWATPSSIRTSANVMTDVPLYAAVDLEAVASARILADFDLDMLEQRADGAWMGRLRHENGLVFRIEGREVVLMGVKSAPQ